MPKLNNLSSNTRTKDISEQPRGDVPSFSRERQAADCDSMYSNNSMRKWNRDNLNPLQLMYSLKGRFLSSSASTILRNYSRDELSINNDTPSNVYWDRLSEDIEDAAVEESDDILAIAHDDDLQLIEDVES